MQPVSYCRGLFRPKDTLSKEQYYNTYILESTRKPEVIFQSSSLRSYESACYLSLVVEKLNI